MNDGDTIRKIIRESRADIADLGKQIEKERGGLARATVAKPDDVSETDCQQFLASARRYLTDLIRQHGEFREVVTALEKLLEPEAERAPP